MKETTNSHFIYHTDFLVVTIDSQWIYTVHTEGKLKLLSFTLLWVTLQIVTYCTVGTFKIKPQIIPACHNDLESHFEKCTTAYFIQTKMGVTKSILYSTTLTVVKVCPNISL